MPLPVTSAMHRRNGRRPRIRNSRRSRRPPGAPPRSGRQLVPLDRRRHDRDEAALMRRPRASSASRRAAVAAASASGGAGDDAPTRAPAAAATAPTIASSSGRSGSPRPMTWPTILSPEGSVGERHSPGRRGRRARCRNAPPVQVLDRDRHARCGAAEWLDDGLQAIGEGCEPIGAHRPAGPGQNAWIPVARSGWMWNKRSSPVRCRTRSTDGCGPASWTSVCVPPPATS